MNISFNTLIRYLDIFRGVYCADMCGCNYDDD